MLRIVINCLLLCLCSYFINKVTCETQTAPIPTMGNRQFSVKNENDSEIAEHTSPRLYTNENPDQPFMLNLTNNDESLFNAANPTVVLTHGLNDDGDNRWIQSSRRNYFNRGKYNVIVFDWSYYSHMNYLLAMQYVPKVGAYMAQVLVSLAKSLQLDMSSVHVAGHSLGAHVAGFIGKNVSLLTDTKIGRITGLDPAGPFYGLPILISPQYRLAKGDALYLDIIHTKGGTFGLKQSIGDADFYPNGGSSQPGCDDSTLDGNNCAHFRSALYFAESIRNEIPFTSHKCKSWKAYKNGDCNDNETQNMGFPLDIKTAKGVYYLKTNSESPFARGQK